MAGVTSPHTSGNKGHFGKCLKNFRAPSCVSYLGAYFSFTSGTTYAAKSPVVFENETWAPKSLQDLGKTLPKPRAGGMEAAALDNTQVCSHPLLTPRSLLQAGSKWYKMQKKAKKAKTTNKPPLQTKQPDYFGQAGPKNGYGQLETDPFSNAPRAAGEVQLPEAALASFHADGTYLCLC